MIPLLLESGSKGALLISQRHLFPLPMEPLCGMFMGEEYAGVDVDYKWAPRYKAWLLHSVKPFCGPDMPPLEFGRREEPVTAQRLWPEGDDERD